MAFLSGDVRKTNAVFLLMLLPIIVRLWYEAVVWRLEQGPQMLGFQVLHLAAGGAFALVVAPILLISYFVVYVYLLWVLAVVILRFVPRGRRGLANVHQAITGALAYIAFGCVANFLQNGNLSREEIIGGALLLTLPVSIAAWLIYSGIRMNTNGSNIAV
jgi:hypothetical protein